MKNNILRTKYQQEWFLRRKQRSAQRRQSRSQNESKKTDKELLRDIRERISHPKLRILTSAGRLIRRQLNPFLSMISAPFGRRSRWFMHERGLYSGRISVPRNTWRLSTKAFALPLAFCYLGSLWLRLPYSVADFMRWGMSGVLPTYSAFSRLPLRSVYHILFAPRVALTKYSIKTMAEAVAREIAFEYPAPNRPFQIVRYVTGLRLPKVVARRAFKIWKLLPFLDTTSDLVVMSVIVVAMKLSFAGWNSKPNSDTSQSLSSSSSLPSSSSSSSLSVNSENECFLKAWVDAWEHYWPQDTPWMNSV